LLIDLLPVGCNARWLWIELHDLIRRENDGTPLPPGT